MAPHLDGYRDWTYIDDTVAGILAVWRAPKLIRRLFNISVDESYTMRDLLEAIQAVIPSFDVDVSPGRGDLPANFRSYRAALDPSRARADLGFAPRCDLKTGVARYLDWLMAARL